MIQKMAAAALMVVAPLASAEAQSVFGDTNLSYSGGVVYDDDLVPGRGPNQSFLPGETGGEFTLGGSRRTIRQSSRNLIGSDGRIRDAYRSSGMRSRNLLKRQQD